MQITSTGSSDDSSNSSSLCPFHQKNWENRKMTICQVRNHQEVSSLGYFQLTTKNIRSFWNYVVNSFDVVKGYLTGQFNPMPFMIRPGVFKFSNIHVGALYLKMDWQVISLPLLPGRIIS
jgi:hypothetical protein